MLIIAQDHWKGRDAVWRQSLNQKCAAQQDIIDFWHFPTI